MTARIITISGPKVDAAVLAVRDEYRLDSVTGFVSVGAESDGSRVIGISEMEPDEVLRLSDALRQFARARGART